MTRLRRRLVAILAVALAVGIAVPLVALVKSRSERRVADVNARLAQVARDILLTTGEGRPGHIRLGVYTQVPRGPGQPLTAVLDKQGFVRASDRTVPSAARKAATARAARGDDDPVVVAGVRMVALSIEGAKGRIGAILAYERAQPVVDDRRNDVLLFGGIALAGWLLVVGAAALLVRRTLVPASAEEAFLADAAHELRTPLAVIRARAESGTPEDLAAIEVAATGAAETVTNLLELARLDAGRAIGEREPLQLDALVATCVSERGGEMVASEPVVVEGDERLLSRAVGNLIDNAMRHGGGLVSVSVDRAGDLGRVTVRDRGPGVAPGQRERIFERFHGAGTGLGLPITRMIAQAHGGTVTLSDGAEGATFVLTVKSRPARS